VRFIAAILTLAFLAGCGGDDDKPARRPAPSTTTEATAPPKATTNEPPGARTGPPPEETAPADDELRPVGRSFRCDGKPQRVLSASGPVEVAPRVVAPGQSFTVTITEASAREALVQLTGLTDVPIQATARESGGRLRATLRMPSRAPCGNKLVTIEGDVSGQAYVAVRR